MVFRKNKGNGRIPVSLTRPFPPSVPGRARPLGEPALPHVPLFQVLCQTPPKTAGVEPGPPANTSMGCFLSWEGRLPRRPGSFCMSLIGYSSIRKWVGERQALLVSESGMRPKGNWVGGAEARDEDGHGRVVRVGLPHDLSDGMVAPFLNGLRPTRAAWSRHYSILAGRASDGAPAGNTPADAVLVAIDRGIPMTADDLRTACCACCCGGS